MFQSIINMPYDIVNHVKTFVFSDRIVERNQYYRTKVHFCWQCQISNIYFKEPNSSDFCSRVCKQKFYLKNNCSCHFCGKLLDVDAEPVQCDFFDYCSENCSILMLQTDDEYESDYDNF